LLTRRNGPRARLLDLVPGRSGKTYADWLNARGEPFTTGIGTATLDPFRGYYNAIRDQLEDPTAVLDAFHVVRLGLKAMEETRRRVQQEQLGHRGRKPDPLYRIRNALRVGAERLTARQITRIETGLQDGDPHFEVTVAWRCYQQLRSAFHARSLAEGRAIAMKVLESFPSCLIPEIGRFGRTLNVWKEQFLAYLITGRASNGGTEAINSIIELHRRIARGFRNPANYRLRMILAAGRLTHQISNEPENGAGGVGTSGPQLMLFTVGFGPDEGLAAVVPSVDEGPDLDHEVSDGGKHAAADGLAFDDAEPDLDQVQPRSRGRGEVDMDPGVPRHPGFASGCLWAA
jgi:hypothetical protein